MFLIHQIWSRDMSHRVTCQFSFDAVMMLAYISALLFNIETQWWVSWSFLTLLSCCLFIFLWISAESWQLTPEVPEWWFSFFFSPSISISFWYFWKDAPADETSRASCHHHSWPNMQFFIHMHNFLYSFLHSLWISFFFFFLTWRAIRTWFIFYRKIIQCACYGSFSGYYVCLPLSASESHRRVEMQMSKLFL